MPKYEIVQLLPADGWWARFELDGEAFLRPVVAFALIRYASGGTPDTNDDVAGVVLPEGEPFHQLASQMPGFVRYARFTSLEELETVGGGDGEG